MDAAFNKLQEKLLSEISNLRNELKKLNPVDRIRIIFELEEVVEGNKVRMQILTDKIHGDIVRMDQMSADLRRRYPTIAQEADARMNVFIGNSYAQLARMQTHHDILELKLAELHDIRN